MAVGTPSWKKAAWMIVIFLAVYFMPLGWDRFGGAIFEALHLAKWYAQKHVLLCLVPAFFIAGAIGVFVSQASVMRYLGAKANKVLAYGVASVSGSVLAVCSCTVLPLFAGIWRMGAGLGPAATFLYAGPAINVLAIILTARILGPELGVARALCAIVFSIVIGLAMQLIYRREESVRAAAAVQVPDDDAPARPIWKTALLFAGMVGVLVFANWARSGDVRAAFLCCPDGLSTYQVEGRVVDAGDADAVHIVDQHGQEHVVPRGLVQTIQPVEGNALADRIHDARWYLTGALLVVLLVMIWRWTDRPERREWGAQSWSFAVQILPLLLAGVLVAGFLLGRPGHDGLIPAQYVEMLVGDSPELFLSTTGLDGSAAEGVIRGGWVLWTNLFASVFGAFMYFATLTEVPILRVLIDSGMGKGPALALLLAGPALSLPNMLVIRSIMGTRKTIVFCTLVVVMATISGMLFGMMV